MERRRTSSKKTGQTKIDSRLVKCDSAGNLSCIICKTNIKSATIWKVHINSKQHKENLQYAKELRNQICPSTDKPKLGITAKKQINENINITPTSKASNAAVLPSNFFDDCKKSDISKAESKNIEEELALFQLEIRAEANIINSGHIGEQQRILVENELKELDEQISKYNVVIALEKKKERIFEKSAHKTIERRKTARVCDLTDEEDATDVFYDWRSKAFF